MKATSACFKVIRRVASEVIASAEEAISTVPGTTSGKAYFDELPIQLKNFFAKYPPKPFAKYSETSTATNAPDANPFQANKHPITNAWHNPKYSMREQADLWKAAYRFGIEDLLPNLLHNRVFYEARYDSKPVMRGARFFKLSKAERTAPERAEKRRLAYLEIDNKLIANKGKRMENVVASRKERLRIVVPSGTPAAEAMEKAKAEAAEALKAAENAVSEN